LLYHLPVQIPAGSHSGYRAICRGGDHLTNVLAAAIAGNKEALCCGAAVFSAVKIAPVVQSSKFCKGLIFRHKTNGKECAIHANMGSLSGDLAAQLQAGQAAIFRLIAGDYGTE